MEIQLVQEGTNVYRYPVKAEVEFSSHRDDYKWICQKAAERGNNLNRKYIGELLGLTNSQTWVLFHNMVYLGLIDKDGTLTRDGKRAANNGIVFLKEEGIYNIWDLPSHVLFSNNPYVYWNRATPIASSSLKHEKVFQGEEMEALDNSGERSREWNITAKAVTQSKTASGSLNISWQWVIENENKKIDQHIAINGYLDVTNEKGDHQKIPVSCTLPSPINIEYMEMEQRIQIWLDKLNWSWDFKNHAIKLGCDDCSLEEMESFEKKNVDVGTRNVHTQPFNITLQNIAIIPKSKKEAEKWAINLFTHQVDQYLSEHEQRGLYYDIVKSTVLQSFDLKFEPEHIRELIGKNDMRKYWYLQAGVDLNLDPQSQSPEISLGQELSMKEGLNILFPECNFSSAKTIVYMERHALWDGNQHRTLRLIQSLRELGFDGDFILIAGDPKNTISKEIKNLAQIKLYSKVFTSGSKPHGRYILVQERRNTHFYEMTHNLTHQKESFSSPGKLIWRDISATKKKIDIIRNDPTRGKLLQIAGV